MESFIEFRSPACPVCGEATYRAAGARVLAGNDRAYSLQFRWVCSRCGYEHVDAALKRFNESQAQAVRLMRAAIRREQRDPQSHPPAAA